jgi:hypothetical protein
MKIYKTISIALVYALITSCTKSYYVAPQLKQFATVSFSNLSPEMPEIHIKIKDKIFQINSNYIEQKKPQDKSKYKINIPINEMITFQYIYNWLIYEKRNVVSIQNGFYSNINLNSSKDTNICKSTISFKPKANKHYEVYFGITSTKCTIKASGTLFKAGPKKLLIKITNGNCANKHQCPNKTLHADPKSYASFVALRYNATKAT